MSRTARLPFIVGMVVLVAALVTLVVRSQGDDAGLGAASDDAITAEDDPAGDPEDRGPTEDPAAEGEDAAPGPAAEERADDGVQAAQRSDRSPAGDDAFARGEVDPAERPASDDRSATTPGEVEDGALAAEPPDGAVTRDRVPGLDPLPDTGATPVALGLLSLGALALVPRADTVARPGGDDGRAG